AIEGNLEITFADAPPRIRGSDDHSVNCDFKRNRLSMKTHNAENERVKRAYFIYLKEARRRCEASIDAVAKALNRFEVYTRFKSFKAFRTEQAVAFKNHLVGQISTRTLEPLSKATAYATLAALKAFFQWLAGQPGFKSRLSSSHEDY